MRGLRIFSGDTQWGKSTLAEKQALEANDLGQAFLIIDRMPAKNWTAREHASSVDDVLRQLYGKPARNVIYTPRSEAEVNRLLAYAHEAGCGNAAKNLKPASRTIFWDECSIDMSPNYISDEASQALRGWAHSNNLYLLTTQRFHEVHGVIYVCSPSIRVFHTEHEKSLERVKAELRLDVEKIRTQKVGECEIYGRDQ